MADYQCTECKCKDADGWAVVSGGMIDAFGLGTVRGLNFNALTDPAFMPNLREYIEELMEMKDTPADCIIDFIISNVVRFPGQMTFPETGQWDMPPGWEMDIAVTNVMAMDAIMADDAEGTGNG